MSRANSSISEELKYDIRAAAGKHSKALNDGSEQMQSQKKTKLFLKVSEWAQRQKCEPVVLKPGSQGPETSSYTARQQVLLCNNNSRHTLYCSSSVCPKCFQLIHTDIKIHRALNEHTSKAFTHWILIRLISKSADIQVIQTQLSMLVFSHHSAALLKTTHTHTHTHQKAESSRWIQKQPSNFFF